jgi:hypothetical protein
MEKKLLFGNTVYPYAPRYPAPDDAIPTDLDEPAIQARLELGNDA